MRKNIFLLIAFAVFQASLSHGQFFPVSAIPDSLKENAHYVVRDFTTTIELKSASSGSESIRRVVTVLDREGEKYVPLLLHYDKYSDIDIKQITFFDASGKKIRSVKQSEIEDYPAFRSFELYSEERMKYFKADNPELPYTIEYDFVINESNIISLGRWAPVTGYYQSVQHASLTLTRPDNVKINRKETGISVKSSVARDNLVSETLEMNNIRAIEPEPLDPGIAERTASVYLMPSVLNFNRHEGLSDTWEQYGRWAFDLYEGRDEIPLELNIKLTALLSDVKDTLSMIRILYKYLQDNTRYVAVTLGIGGYQPIDAATVYKTGYGECKALSNLMYSMLKFAGIKSYPALVSAGSYRPSIYRDFPNFSQFNHVIVCVPLGRDTLWLECTDQRIPMGFLGDFTDDRDALLLTKKGGLFAHTVKYEAKDNLRSGRSEFVIDSTGKASFKSDTKFKGLQYDDLAPFLRSNQDEQKKWLYSNTSIPSLVIKGFSVVETPGRLPLVSLNQTGASANFCTFSGKYMVLPLNLINFQKPVQKMLKPRQSDILVTMSSIDADTLVYRLPEGYTAESLPAGAKLNSKFGSYSSSVLLHGDEITFIRRYEIKGGRYKPSEYKMLYDYILSVSKADNAKVLLYRK